MASRSSIAALLRCRSTAALLPASGEREFIPSSASAPLSSRSAVPAASSSSPATRDSPAISILKGLRVRGGRGEVMAQSGTGGPVRGYHAFSRRPHPERPCPLSVPPSDALVLVRCHRWELQVQGYPVGSDCGGCCDRCLPFQVPSGSGGAQAGSGGAQAGSGGAQAGPGGAQASCQQAGGAGVAVAGGAVALAVAGCGYVGSPDWDRSPESMH